MGTSTFYITS